MISKPNFHSNKIVVPFMLLLVSLAVLRVGAVENEPVRQRFLLNNDGTNLFWRPDLTMEMVQQQVSECPDAITTYLLCPNGIQKMMYPSAYEELATRGGLPALVAAGEDPFGAFLEGLKQRGLETFVTFRMNEVHNVDNPDDPDLTTFWHTHPEYRVERGEKPTDWAAQCLDYSLEPVREYNLNLILEIMEKYQPDGIELDWMRFYRHLSGNTEQVWEKRHFLTEVVAKVREAADRLSQRLGRPMLVAVRVPTNLAGCRWMGIDIAEWNRQELMDFMTVSPFLATDYTMPIDEMRRALQDRAIPIYAGIEFGYCGKSHTEASIRAAALNLYTCGADGIYLFNFPCWRELQPHPPWSWVPLLADPARMLGRDLTFPIINGHYRIGHVDLPHQLPIDIKPNEDNTLELTLPPAALSELDHPAAASFYLESESSLKLKINGTEIKSCSDIPIASLRAGSNAILLENHGTEAARVTNAELRLTYPLIPANSAERPRQLEIYVSPSGSDSNPGTQDAPIQTLQHAQVMVRANNQAMTGDIIVHLGGGTYALDEPLNFDASDSGTNGFTVRYQSKSGETPILSGGKTIRDWQKVEGGRWKARVEAGEFRQLYVNGVRAVRARGVCPEGIERNGDLEAMDAEAGYLFPDGSMADWKNPSDIELGYYSSWSHMTAKVEQITRDLSGRSVVSMLQPWFFLVSRKEGRQAELPDTIENALELLDEPGEWYYDRSERVIYYMPRDGEILETASATVPVLETLLSVTGELERPVHDLSFAGLTFADATWVRPNQVGHPDVQANFIIHPTNLYQRDGFMINVQNEYLKSPANIVLHAANGCRFERCTFTRLGGAGLDIEYGSQNNSVVGCRFYDISGSAIQIGDVLSADHHPDDPRLLVQGNRVIDSVIYNIGVEYRDSIGVFAGYTNGTIIAHNEIYDLPYSAVSVGWGWGEADSGAGNYATPIRYTKPTPCGNNRIEGNHIHHVMMKQHDGGAVYTLGNQPGTVIRDNHIHDTGSWPGGIYLDEGSGFIEVTGNCVYRVETPMNYNNRNQNRIQTCFEHDNFFGIEPDGEGFPEEVVQQAGLESAYRDVLNEQ